MLKTLKRRRKALGLSQIELAKMVGVSVVSFQLWEREVCEPRPENLNKLQHVLYELEKEQKNWKEQGGKEQ